MVTAVTINPGNVAGQVLDWTGAQTFRVPKTTGVITRGQILVKNASTSPDSYKLATAASNIAGPFVMALETVASGATTISVVSGGTWIVTADGTIEIGDEVQLSTSTDGQVVKAIAEDVTETPSETTIEAAFVSMRKIIGVCRGFADSANTGQQVAAVDGDLVAIEADRNRG